MKLKNIGLLSIALGLVMMSGCATYRTSSNIESGPALASASNAQVIISEGSLAERAYKEIGPIRVTVKKLTAFHKDPTKEQVDEALIEKARVMGADAVINVVYKSGVGLTTWGYMEAKGTGVKLAE